MANRDSNRLSIDREILSEANSRGPFSKLAAFLRLSGPGWLQSAITLGGGSLTGALYLGALGGPNMLWLQLLAIGVGVIMLSAIAYVTLSTKIRPYQAINQYVNPVLGVGWITATILANMIFILPQFALCFDTLDSNIFPTMVENTDEHKVVASSIIAVIAMFAVVMSFKPGWASRIFDFLLKLIVGAIVVCFVAAVYFLIQQDEIAWNTIWSGFIPDLSLWNNPAPELSTMLGTLPDKAQGFWEGRILGSQQKVIIGTAATAVGINMTFLLPYSMLARGWDKPFRGLARFDLVTAMAIPFVLVTSCIVLASAHAFHAKADENFLSSDVEQIQQSPLFEGSTKSFTARYDMENGEDAFAKLTEGVEGSAADLQLATFVAGLEKSERILAASLVKPNTSQLAESLKPLLGERANLIFGLGAFAMGFSTIIILMLINGYAFAELLGRYDDTIYRILGTFLAAATGFCWVWLFQGESKTWLMIVASTFAAILLPIAYLAFFCLMNSKRLLGDEKPRGVRMVIWNVLMLFGVVAALIPAILSAKEKIADPKTGGAVMGALCVFGLLALVGFSARSGGQETTSQ